MPSTRKSSKRKNCDLKHRYMANERWRDKLITAGLFAYTSIPFGCLVLLILSSKFGDFHRLVGGQTTRFGRFLAGDSGSACAKGMVINCQLSASSLSPPHCGSITLYDSFWRIQVPSGQRGDRYLRLQPCAMVLPHPVSDGLVFGSESVCYRSEDA